MTPSNRRVSRPSSQPPLPGQSATVAPSSPGLSPRAARVLAGARAVVGAALVLALSGAVAWAVERHVTRSPRFAVRDLVVTGAHQRSEEAILLEAGLAAGTNIFTLDIDRARALLVADPWISDAKITRRLPGTLRVDVIEREAGAAVVLQKTYLASRDGVLFKLFELGDPADLPIVTGLDPDGVASDRDGAESTIRRALDVASEYEHTSYGARAKVQEIHVTPEGGFTFVVGKDAMSIALGRAPFRRKLEEAGRVLAELDRRGSQAEAIMLDDEARPDRVVVRIR